MYSDNSSRIKAINKLLKIDGKFYIKKIKYLIVCVLNLILPITQS